MAKRAKGLSPEQLLAEIAKGDVRPFYLLHGDEEYEREALVASMIEVLVPAQTRDFNLDVLRAERLEISRVPRKTHAPLTLPGTRSTAEQDDQSNMGLRLTKNMRRDKRVSTNIERH